MGHLDSHSLRRVLAQNIRKIRTQKGLSQEKLADKAGLHRTFIGSVERSERNISLDNIWKLAIALDVEPHVLLIERKS
jgi:transcriptional regulator with XRE-family HTH domain